MTKYVNIDSFWSSSRVFWKEFRGTRTYTDTHIHTHINIYAVDFTSFERCVRKRERECERLVVINVGQERCWARERNGMKGKNEREEMRECGGVQEFCGHRIFAKIRKRKAQMNGI